MAKQIVAVSLSQYEEIRSLVEAEGKATCLMHVEKDDELPSPAGATARWHYYKSGGARISWEVRLGGGDSTFVPRLSISSATPKLRSR